MADTATRRPSPWNAANLVTLCRILAVPVVGVLLYPWGGQAEPGPGTALAAGAVFIVAFVSDMMDGYLARRYNHITALGKLLDPLADKLLVLAALIMLIPLGWVPAWIVAVLLFRELLIQGLRAVAAEEGIVIPASTLAKYKTIYQAVAVAGLILHYRAGEIFGPGTPPPLNIWFGGAGLLLLYVATFISLWSGLDYMVRFWSQLRRMDDSAARNS